MHRKDEVIMKSHQAESHVNLHMILRACMSVTALYSDQILTVMKIEQEDR